MLQELLNKKVVDLRIDYQILIYLSVIGLAILVTYLIIKLLNNKSDKFIFRFIFIVLLTGLVTHFIKPFFKPYTEMDFPLAKLTFENICAVSILLFPIVYFTKNKVLKDYMVIFGVISGIVSFLLPIIILDQKVFSFEVFRFYYVHFVIFLAPFLMARFDVHKISMERAMKVPLVLIGVLTIIFLNEVIITALGWVPVTELFDPSKRNPSLIFGVAELPEIIPIQLHGLVNALTFVTPNFLMNMNVIPNGGFLPVVWMIPMVFIYGILASVFVNYYFERDATKAYFKENIFIAKGSRL